MISLPWWGDSVLYMHDPFCFLILLQGWEKNLCSRNKVLLSCATEGLCWRDFLFRWGLWVEGD